MNGDIHVRICEGLGGKFPGATRPATDETLTTHGGLALFGEYCQGLGLAQWLDQELPAPGSGAGYAPSTHAQALLLSLHGGGRSLEDVRTLRADTGLQLLWCNSGV